MKTKSPQDERVVAQRRKIQSDGFAVVLFVLLISAVVQELFLNAPFKQYAVELICFFGMSAYLLIRNIAIGVNIYGDDKRGKVMPLVNSLASGIGATTVFGILNYSKYAGHYENNSGLYIATLAIFFISVTISAFIAMSLFAYLSNKKQAKIQKQLDEDEQNDE